MSWSPATSYPDRGIAPHWGVPALDAGLISHGWLPHDIVLGGMYAPMAVALLSQCPKKGQKSC